MLEPLISQTSAILLWTLTYYSVLDISGVHIYQFDYQTYLTINLNHVSTPRLRLTTINATPHHHLASRTIENQGPAIRVSHKPDPLCCTWLNFPVTQSQYYRSIVLAYTTCSVIYFWQTITSIELSCQYSPWRRSTALASWLIAANSHPASYEMKPSA
jgi:hypothetical protein